MALLWTVVLTLALRLSTTFGWNYTRCPRACRCYSNAEINVVNCTSQNLNYFPEPETIPADVHVIDLSYNSIYSIPSGYKFWLPVLHEFDLSSNKLAAPPYFNGLRHLKRLNLAKNQISKLDSLAFSGFPNLESLDISKNHISDIDGTSLDKLTALQTLDLRNNSITEVPTIKQSSLLSTLYLDYNLITELPADFIESDKLTSLSLSHNNISRIHPASLSHCTQLAILNLSRNNLDFVPRQLLRGVGKVIKTVDLSGNILSKIRSGDFASLEALEELIITGTNITEIEEYAFEDLQNLRKLDLSNSTKLSFINSQAFSSVPQLQTLQLDGSAVEGSFEILNSLPRLTHFKIRTYSLTCGCGLSHLQKFAFAKKGTILDIGDSQCWNTKTQKYLQLLDVKMEDYCIPYIVKLPSEITLKEGQRLAKSCNVLGDPKPVVKWINPWNEVISSSEFLVVDELSMNHSGPYQCVASSSHGVAIAVMSLNVVKEYSKDTVPKDGFLRMILTNNQRVPQRKEVSFDISGPFELIYEFEEADSYQLCYHSDNSKPLCIHFNKSSLNFVNDNILVSISLILIFIATLFMTVVFTIVFYRKLQQPIASKDAFCI